MLLIDIIAHTHIHTHTSTRDKICDLLKKEMSYKAFLVSCTRARIIAWQKFFTHSIAHATPESHRHENT